VSRDGRLRDAAVSYAAGGWQVFGYRGTSKRPRTRHGSQDATADVDTVAEWWRRYPFDNIGVRIRAGLVVVDLDRHGADERLHCRWSPEDFPPTLTVETGTGWHLWYRAPSWCNLRSTSELPGWHGVEVKRHAVTVPPSVHANGRRYEWVRRVPVVALPGLVVDAFRRESFVGVVRSTEPTEAYVRAARDGICRDLAAASGPGANHDALVRAAFGYRRIGLTVDDALADLLPLVPSHNERDAITTIRSCVR
jgi:hypothetical protein